MKLDEGKLTPKFRTRDRKRCIPWKIFKPSRKCVQKVRKKKKEGVVRTRLYLSTRLKHARTQSLDSAIAPNFPGVSFVNRFYSLHL